MCSYTTKMPSGLFIIIFLDDVDWCVYSDKASVFLKATTLYLGGIRSHDQLLSSPRPRRHGQKQVVLLYWWRFWIIFYTMSILMYHSLRWYFRNTFWQPYPPQDPNIPGSNPARAQRSMINHDREFFVNSTDWGKDAVTQFFYEI
jgi:hypothetical protein